MGQITSRPKARIICVTNGDQESEPVAAKMELTNRMYAEYSYKAWLAGESHYYVTVQAGDKERGQLVGHMLQKASNCISMQKQLTKEIERLPIVDPTNMANRVWDKLHTYSRFQYELDQDNNLLPARGLCFNYARIKQSMRQIRVSAAQAKMVVYAVCGRDTQKFLYSTYYNPANIKFSNRHVQEKMQASTKRHIEEVNALVRWLGSNATCWMSSVTNTNDEQFVDGVLGLLLSGNLTQNEVGSRLSDQVTEYIVAVDDGGTYLILGTKTQVSLVAEVPDTEVAPCTLIGAVRVEVNEPLIRKYIKLPDEKTTYTPLRSPGERYVTDILVQAGWSIRGNLSELVALRAATDTTTTPLPNLGPCISSLVEQPTPTDPLSRSSATDSTYKHTPAMLPAHVLAMALCDSYENTIIDMVFGIMPVTAGINKVIGHVEVDTGKIVEVEKRVLTTHVIGVQLFKLNKNHVLWGVAHGTTKLYEKAVPHLAPPELQEQNRKHGNTNAFDKLAASLAHIENYMCNVDSIYRDSTGNKQNSFDSLARWFYRKVDYQVHLLADKPALTEQRDIWSAAKPTSLNDSATSTKLSTTIREQYMNYIDEAIDTIVLQLNVPIPRVGNAGSISCSLKAIKSVFKKFFIRRENSLDRLSTRLHNFCKGSTAFTLVYNGTHMPDSSLVTDVVAAAKDRRILAKSGGICDYILYKVGQSGMDGEIYGFKWVYEEHEQRWTSYKDPNVQDKASFRSKLIFHIGNMPIEFMLRMGDIARAYAVSGQTVYEENTTDFPMYAVEIGHEQINPPAQLGKLGVYWNKLDLDGILNTFNCRFAVEAPEFGSTDQEEQYWIIGDSPNCGLTRMFTARKDHTFSLTKLNGRKLVTTIPYLKAVLLAKGVRCYDYDIATLKNMFATYCYTGLSETSMVMLSDVKKG